MQLEKVMVPDVRSSQFKEKTISNFSVQTTTNTNAIIISVEENPKVFVVFLVDYVVIERR